MLLTVTYNMYITRYIYYNYIQTISHLKVPAFKKPFFNIRILFISLLLKYVFDFQPSVMI